MLSCIGFRMFLIERQALQCKYVCRRDNSFVVNSFLSSPRYPVTVLQILAVQLQQYYPIISILNFFLDVCSLFHRFLKNNTELENVWLSLGSSPGTIG